MSTLTEKLKSITSLLSLARTTTERRVILFRLDGLSNLEIAVKLNLEPQEVAAMRRVLDQRYRESSRSVVETI